MNNFDQVFIVIPAYNEGQVLESTLNELKKIYKNILVIDDGSTDNTEEILKSSGVKYISHPINLGQGSAISTAFKYLQNKKIKGLVSFDADGQHSVEDSVTFAKEILSCEEEIIFGSRFLKHKDNVPIIKRLALSLATKIHNFLGGVKLTDSHNGLKAYKRECLKKIDVGISRFAFESEIIFKVGEKKLRYKELPTNIKYTEYSMGKGQKLRSGLIIIEALLFKIIRK